MQEDYLFLVTFFSSQTSLASSGSGRKQRRSVERRSGERRRQPRSPSERKIGIVRRRSQEMARKASNAVAQVKSLPKMYLFSIEVTKNFEVKVARSLHYCYIYKIIQTDVFSLA